MRDFLYTKPMAWWRSREECEKGELKTTFAFTSFVAKEISLVGENNSMPNSLAFPSYMAMTEFARAKVRLMSTKAKNRISRYMLPLE